VYLEYNGVKFFDAQLNGWEIEPILDQSDQDWLYDRHVIGVVVMLNPAMVSGVTGPKPANGEFDWSFTALPGIDAGTIEENLRKVLAAPRKQLKIYNGASQSLSVPAAFIGAENATSDCNNGPKVRRCDVVRAAGNQMFELHFVVEVCTRSCPQGDTPPYAKSLLSNRYSVTHSVDERHFLTIQLEGLAIFRTDMVNLEAGKLAPGEEMPDWYRSQLIPAPPDGFQRLSMKYTMVPSRNAMAWSVVDKEMPVYLGNKATNPWGVVDFQSTVSSTFLKKDGVAIPRQQMTVQCRAAGSNTSSLWKLTKFCAAVARSKLQIGRYAAGLVITNDFQVTQHIHDRVVELVWSVTLPGTDSDVFNSTLPNTFDSTLSDDGLRFLYEKNGKCPNPPNDNATRGTYPYMAVANNIATAVACGGVASPRSHHPYFVKPTSGGKGNLPVGPHPPAPTPKSLVSPVTAKNTDLTPRPILSESSFSGTINGIGVQIDVATDLPQIKNSYRDLAHQYSYYTCFVKYEPMYGKLIMPICGGANVRPGQKRASAIDTHSPYMVKVIRWEATRVGKWPEMPNPITVASQNTVQDETLLAAPRTFGAPVKTPDGTAWVFSAKGEYRYLMQRSFPVEGVNQFPVALVPWLSGKFSDCYVPADAFVHYVTEDYPQSTREKSVPKDFGTPWPPAPGQWDQTPTADGLG